MRRNLFREKLKAGQPTLGTHLHSSWPSVVEAVGHTGMFDYVEFVAEYAPFDLFSLDNFCRAVELFDLSAMIKVDQEPRKFLAQRAIGSGFQSVLFADVRSAADALECIQAVRPDTPTSGGNFGAAARRFAYMGYGGGPQYVEALNDVVVALMIEKESAVNELDAILEVPGVDMVQWGPADYSMSIGKPGAWYSPEVREVERHVIETCLKHGVPPRIEINSADQAQYYQDLGVRHFCVGTDIFVLHDWFKRTGEAFRALL